MPFDAFAFGVVHSSMDRRDIRRFPQLANQVRCSSGFTVAEGGVMRALSPLQKPAPAAKVAHAEQPRRQAAPDLHSRLLDYLHQLAREGALLPQLSEICDRFARNSGQMVDLFDTLERKGWIVQWHGTKKSWCGERIVRIVDTGAVLRTKNAPRFVTV